MPGDRVEVVVRKLAPLLFDMPFELLSITFDHVPIHFVSLRR